MIGVLPEWSVLKTAAGSRLARLSTFAPVIGWVLVKNDAISKYLAKYLGDTSFGEPSASLYSWYCGLFLFGLGALLFGLACPATIKNYESNESYRDRRLTNITLADVGMLADQSSSGENDRLSCVCARLKEEPIGFMGDKLSHEQFIRDKKADLLELLDAHYTIVNRSMPFIRLLISALILFGGLFALAPGLLTFLSVLSLFVSKVIGVQ